MENKTEVRARRQVYVISVAASRAQIWKHLFFMKKDIAFNAVKKFYGEFNNWKVTGDVISCTRFGSFHVMTLKEYRTIADVPYSQNSKRIKGEDHK